MLKAYCATALAIALTACMAPAIAGIGGPPSAQLDMLAHGPGVCQAALPSFEGQIRKRPLAIQNEGTAVAFVSCSLPQFTQLNDPASGLYVSFINNSNTAATVSCTGISYGSGNFVYIPKSIVVPANTSFDFAPVLSWSEQDEDGGSHNIVSCALPPGTGITQLRNDHGEVLIPDPAP